MEICAPCGAKVPKEEAIEFKLFLGGKRVKRYVCQSCFAKLIFPHLLTEKDKQRVASSLSDALDAN
jgi:hypothetical protein